MAKILVAGGAGYVGSSACAWLIENGHDVWVLDDLSLGYALVQSALKLKGFTRARVGNREAVLPLLKKERFDCVLHFAAHSLVGESVARPELYQENNVDQTKIFLSLMQEAGIQRFVFSSTCAVFGDPGVPRISEDHPKNPINPYGKSKLEVEKHLQELARDNRIQAVALRYFNAAGAEPGLRVGELHQPETHLIPRVLQAIQSGRQVEVFGTDYPTKDGTCIRDYVHVTDLAAAHGAAIQRLLAKKGESGSFEAFNLGSETGYSVREVIAACEKALGKKAHVIEKPRRPGDPPLLVADASLASRELGFRCVRSLEDIVASALAWEKKKRSLLRKAVFLDRDGTLNEDPGYLSDPDQLKILPGVAEALRDLKWAGFLLIVVSNQSGISRGLIRADALTKIHQRMNELLGDGECQPDRYEFCTHHPDDDCECRKPKPKLLLGCARELGIDLSRSYMVGDKASDLGAGRNAGTRGSALVRTGDGTRTESIIQPGDADFIGNSLPEVVRWILDRENAGF